MKKIGIICEYNPFHNGHLYHLKKAREITGADSVIVVMSGNYVQRGTPAIIPKHLRAKSALLSGADLVLELPVCYASGSAEFFAEGAVSLLDSLGCIDSICFGSECGDCDTLGAAAQILAEEPQDYKTALQNVLREGLSFPQARQNALKEYLTKFVAAFNEEAPKNVGNLTEILAQPNNILGIEYMKALVKRQSNIKCYSIKRIGAGYHDHELTEQYSSASAIRQNIAAFDQNIRSTDKPSLPEHLKHQLPSCAWKLMEETYGTRCPVYANDFSLLLKYKLLQETKQSLASYMDISEDLANRILNLRNEFAAFDDFCDILKTKDTTYTRISRGLLHILLNIKTEDFETYKTTGYCHYAHILGFRKDSAKLLSLLKKTSKVPLLTKLTKTGELSDSGRKMLSQDIFASDLYESVITEKFRTPFINEYKQQIIRI